MTKEMCMESKEISRKVDEVRKPCRLKSQT